MPKNLDLESGAVEEGGSVEKRRTPIASDGLERLKTTVDHNHELIKEKIRFYFKQLMDFSASGCYTPLRKKNVIKLPNNPCPYKHDRTNICNLISNYTTLDS